MSLYIGLVHKDPDSCYGMSFPDAPGCFSAADTPEDIYKMAREALTVWLEVALEDGLPVPATRSVEDIRKDPEWADSFQDAAFLIGVDIDLPMKAAA